MPNAAVNLYPDPSSREFGRGVFADGTGSFSFPECRWVCSRSGRHFRQAGGHRPGFARHSRAKHQPRYRDSLNHPRYGTLRGQVFDSDNLTPVPNARVYLGKYDSGANNVRDVVRMAESGCRGCWEATNAPIQSSGPGGVHV